MDEDGLPIVGTGIDYTKVKSGSYNKTVVAKILFHLFLILHPNLVHISQNIRIIIQIFQFF